MCGEEASPEGPALAHASGSRWRKTSPRRPPMAKLRSCFSFWHPSEILKIGKKIKIKIKVSHSKSTFI